MQKIPLSDQEIELLSRHEIRYVPLNDPEYPQALREIHSPPPVLYVRGSRLNIFNKMIAVVGSRKADFYGTKVINEIVPSLVANQWTIVSGGAIGADSMAHAATLKSLGKTIAVFGSGLLVPYPLQNKKLFQRIIDSDGTLVSPFPLTMPPLQHHFPARNRIISGMSKGVIVVQAAQQSGASITAKFALDQGRDVFAVPGPIDNPLSIGCNRLIQQGAKLVQNAGDILEEFGEEVSTSMQSNQATQTLNTDLSSIDLKIVELCKNPVPAVFIAQSLAMDLSDTYSKLFNLQIEGKISQNAAGLFQVDASF